MPLTPDEFEGLVKEVYVALAGHRVRGVHDEGAHALVVTFRGAGEARLLEISTSAKAPWLALVPCRSAAPPQPSARCARLRRRLLGRRLELAWVDPVGRALVLAFVAGPELEVEGEPRRSVVSRELLALVLRGDRPVATVARGPAGSARELLTAGGAAAVEAAVAAAVVAEGGAWDAGRLAPIDARLDGAGSDELLSARAATVFAERFPLSARISPREVELEQRCDADVVGRELGRRISRLARRKRRALEKIDAERASFEAASEDLRRGELLKAARHELRRGLEEIEVTDWYDPGLAKVRVRLDPRLAPDENIERYFSRHRKARRALPLLEKRSAALREELEALGRLADAIAEATTPAEMEPLAGELDRIDPPRIRKRAAVETGAGPRSFTSADGFEILVGRNSRQNDELTRRIARGNDLFLHVSGRPGAHVVIRSVPGKSVPKDTLLDAAQLALYFSLAERSSRTRAEGATAEVDYTPVKYLSRPKGAPPGLVLLSRHKTLRVSLDASTLDRLTGTVGRD